jgi:hypothetical protein
MGEILVKDFPEPYLSVRTHDMKGVPDRRIVQAADRTIRTLMAALAARTRQAEEERAARVKAEAEVERQAKQFRMRWQHLERLILNYRDEQHNLSCDYRDDAVTVICLIRNTLPRVEEMTVEQIESARRAQEGSDE